MLSAIGSALPSWQALVFLALMGGMVALGSLYLATQRTVLLDINGAVIEHRTRKTSPQGILRELGLVLHEQDVLQAPGRLRTVARPSAVATIRVTIARQVILLHDGSVTQVSTQAGRVGEALVDTAAVIFAQDRLFLEGEPCTLDTELPPLELTVNPEAKIPARTLVKTLLQEIRRPVRLSVRRAVAISIQDGPIPIAFHTTARTVGEALFERGIAVYLGDRIFPDLGTEITPGLVVFVERSKPVTLDVGGANRMLRTRCKTVADLLAAEQVSLGDKDYVLPSLEESITSQLHVAVVRVHDEHYLEEIPIAFETRWETDPAMEIDQRKIVNWGREGARRRRIRVHYENESELYHMEEEGWIAHEPQDRVINYGTEIVLRELETPSGTVTYWRKLRMLATSYNAPTAGKSSDHPQYGITRLGWRARKGIIAVDPRVISLGQEMYVPDYGPGVAADTGGAIKWRRVDLCFDDDNLELWYRWVDVYLVAPVPAEDEIKWVIPNYPVEKE